jgi:PKD repeat protein
MSAPLTVVADASGSSDTDQTPINNIVFDFGDGNIEVAGPGARATHTYARAGTYTITVTVTDMAHLFSKATEAVNVS